MASGKMSPRQKMINMMYLVLIALLAMNVSKEIIKAFNLFENSLISSTVNIVKKNKVIVSALNKQIAQENTQAKTAMSFVTKVTGTANAFTTYIENLKEKIEGIAGGRNLDPAGMLVKGGVAELAKGDDIEGHANYFLHKLGEKEVGEKDFNNGAQLQKKINDTRVEMLKHLEDAIKAGLAPSTLTSALNSIKSKSSLVANNQTTTDGSESNWYEMYIVETPAASVMAMLSKLQNDARNLESEINTSLARAVGAEDFKFDALEAVVSAPTSAILRGETYEADIILAAYDSKANMNMSVNGRPLKIEDGKGKFTAGGGSPGEYTYKVKIAVPNPTGGAPKIIEGEGAYSVFEPAASISADKLDMIYIGLDNPMSITVAGVNPRNVKASASGVSLRQVGGGKYKALASRPGNATISVSATVKGRNMPMGKRQFRVRPVPNPVFKAGAISFDQETISLNALKFQPSATAPLLDFIYVGIKFKVVGYNFTALGQKAGLIEQKSRGASLAPIKGALNKLRPGDFVQFTGIKVIGPDGRVRPIANVAAKLKK